MMRASMAEVMNSQYVRTAVLKGMPFSRVVMKHALRNALIAPFTVMVLQINYLLSGVIVTEVVFAYDGFGRRLYEAAQFSDIYIVEACTMIAVALAVMLPSSSRKSATPISIRASGSAEALTAMTDLAIPHAAPASLLPERLVGLSAWRCSGSRSIGMVGLAIVLFWLVLAILAPILPLIDPLAQFCATFSRSR